LKLECGELGRRFGAKWALQGVSLSVETSRFAVLGPNGSGKTTLLSILVGLRRPTTGWLRVNGFEPYRDRARASRELCFTFEKPRLSLGLRVRDVVDILERAYGNKAKEYVSVLGLENFKSLRLRELSSGQAQILTLLVSLCKGGLLVLDEPFTHLDAYTAGRLIQLVYERGEVVLATHIPEEAESVADYLIVVDNGRVRWCGSLDELYSASVCEVFCERFVQPEKLFGDSLVVSFGRIVLVKGWEPNELLKIPGVIGVRRSGVRRVYAEIRNKR